MGIYLPNMEMPKDNTVLLRIYPKDKLNELYVEQLDIDGDTLNEYWAVELPPHGRLIDADALIENCMKEDGFLAEMLFRKVNNAPTILEAEEGE